MMCLNCCNFMIKLTDKELLPVGELRTWFLEMDLTLDVGAMKITTMTTKNLEYHIHSVKNSVAYTPRKPDLKETRAPQCPSHHCL